MFDRVPTEPDKRRVLRAWTPEEILAGLDRADMIDRRFVAALHRHREAILPAVQDAADNASGWLGLHACDILLELGDARGGDGLVRRVVEGDPETRYQALRALAYARYKATPDKPQHPLNRAAIFAAVKPLLGASERRIAELALAIIERLQTEESDALLLPLVAATDPKMRRRTALWMARRGWDRGALDVVETFLFSAETPRSDVSGLISILEALCQADGAEIRDRACSQAVRFIRENLHNTDLYTADYIMRCIGSIAIVAPPIERDLLLDVMNSAIPPRLRGMTLGRLAELEGDAGLARLSAALNDPALRQDAVKALAKLAKGAGNVQIADALGAALEGEHDPWLIAEMTQTLMMVGGASRALLRRTLARCDPITAMAIHWLLKGFSASDVAAGLVAADIADPPDEARMTECEAVWENTRHAIAVLATAARPGGRLDIFTLKTSDPVADLTEFLDSLSRMAGGRFPIGNVWQEVSADENSMQLGFTHQGTNFTLPIEYPGRYVDLTSLLKGLDGVLRATRNPGRFFELEIDAREWTLIMFANRREFPKIARKFRIPIRRDNA